MNKLIIGVFFITVTYFIGFFMVDIFYKGFGVEYVLLDKLSSNYDKYILINYLYLFAPPIFLSAIFFFIQKKLK